MRTMFVFVTQRLFLVCSGENFVFNIDCAQTSVSRGGGNAELYFIFTHYGTIAFLNKLTWGSSQLYPIFIQ